MTLRSILILAPVVAAAAGVLPGGAAADPVRPPTGAASAQARQDQPRGETQQFTDLDRFMERVLQRREETWRTLHDYVLDEAEHLRILGPGGVPLHGMKREFTWYVREGMLVRSPVRFDGVALNDDERRRYEQRWLEQEKKREAKAAARKTAAGKKTDEEVAGAAGEAAGEANPSLQDFVDRRGEPRFVSEAYFLRFKFEPGNYYFAGHDTVEGRPVVKVEYYPKRLYEEEHRENERAQDGKKKREVRLGGSKDKAREDEYERKFNKVALVTLWIDPAEHQIVRYTFDNMDFGFLPGRWLVRLDEIRASMTMARVFDGVWLPAEIDMQGGLSLATGAYRFQYGRRFTNYRKAETGARIREMTPKDQ